MTQILLLVEQKENRRLLLEWLAVYYEVLLPNSTENIDKILPFNQSFDMGIVDGLALKRHWQWIAAQKQAEGPVCLPFLLITSRSDVGMATRFIWQTIDDLIIAPIEKIELQARVEILLRSRQLSLTLKLSHDQLDRSLQTAATGRLRAIPRPAQRSPSERWLPSLSVSLPAPFCLLLPVP